MRILKGPAFSGHELEAADVFWPESMGLAIEERKGTATITAGPEAPDITVGAWLQDDTEPGRGIIWRVKSVENRYETETRTIQLEHIVNTLRDAVMFGEIGPKEITGNSGATSCTAAQAVGYIVGQTPHWQVWGSGVHSDYASVSGPFSFNGENLFAALETVTGALEEAYWDYDLTVYPFKIRVWKYDATVSCEMRMNRNIQTARRVIDRSRMYTRLYPIGENDLHIDGDYVSANEETYGTVCRIETAAGKKTKAELLAWANERLARHCEPAVTITISGLELSQATGETMDRLQINRLCRAPLPEYHTFIVEKITKLNWADKIHEPEKVTVTLANMREDVASIVNRISKSAGSAARAKAAKDKEDHAWFVDTEDHVGMVAEAIIGRGPDGVDWSRVASLIVDGDGIHGRVTRAEGYMVTLAAEMDLTEERLRIAFENNINSTRSEFRMTAESLRIAFENDINCTRSEFKMTSESLRIAFENGISCTRSEFLMTSESLRIAFENGISCTRSEFLMTSESLRIAFENGISCTRSEFLMTSESLRIAFESDVSSVRSAIETEAGRISLVVSGTGSNATIKAAEITAEINKTGSTARINANRVVIGDSGTTTTLNDKITIGSGGTMIIDGAVAMHDLSIYAGNGITFNGAAGGQYWELNAAALVGLIKNLKIEQSGNTYTLYKKSFAGSDDADADWAVVGTFSKASTIKGTWSGGVYTVSETAAASGGVSPPISTTIGERNKSWSGNVCTVSIGYEDPISGNMIATGCSIQVDASARYLAGRNDTKVSSTFSWEHAADYTSGDHNTLTVTTDAPDPVSGASKSLVLYLTQGTGFTTGHLKSVYLRTGSDKGNIVAVTNVDASGEYTDGWEDCYDDIGLNYSTRQTISPGSSINVYPACKATPTGQHASITTKGITVEASAATHTVASFDVWAPASESLTINGTSYSNNSSGYYLSSTTERAPTVYIITKGSWTCDGVSKSGKSYLGAAPKAVYTAGWDNGQAALKNAGGAVTESANNTYTLNQYVTTLTVNVPISHSPVTSEFTAQSSDPGSSYTLRTVSPDASVKWYKYTATCGGVTTNYRLKVDSSAVYTLGANDLKNAGGTVSATSNGTSTLNKYVTTLTVNVSATHAITNFETANSTNKGVSISGETRTTNAYGYHVKNAKKSTVSAIISTIGTWKCDGVSKSGESYLMSAPTALYKQAWLDFYNDTDSWDGCWTSDGTGGTSSCPSNKGYHYVTGPTSTPGGWCTYYCVESLAESAGIACSTPGGHSDDPGTGYWKTFALSAGYSWFDFKITIGKITKWIKLHIVSA